MFRELEDSNARRGEQDCCDRALEIDRLAAYVGGCDFQERGIMVGGSGHEAGQGRHISFYSAIPASLQLLALFSSIIDVFRQGPCR